MSLLIQHILALMLVGGCVAYVVWQLALPFLGRRAKLGNCCAHGCGPATDSAPQAAKREMFLPVEFVGTNRRSKANEMRRSISSGR